MLYHRALSLLVCAELADRWSVTQLISSAHSVGARALPPTPLLDHLEWRPVLLLAAAAAAGSLCGSRLARLVLLVLHVALSLVALTLTLTLALALTLTPNAKPQP